MKQLLTLLAVLFAAPICAQSVITGRVIDKQNQPLPGANIYFEGTYEGTSSDQQGNFKLVTDLEGTYELVVDFMGFETHRTSLEMPQKEVVLEIVLKEKFNELKAATIAAGAFEASDTKKAVVLRPLDIVTTAGASGDISGALQTLPGTSTVGESGKLFVRGGSSEETATFIDGLLVYKPYTSSAPNTQVRGRFNPFMFSGTVFTTGGYSAEYGQALSSALLLNTNDLPAQSELNLSIMSVGGDIAGTAKWESGAVTANVGYTNLAPYLALVPQNYEFEKPIAAVSGAVSIRQKVGKSGMVKGYSTYSRSNFILSQSNSEYDNGILRVDLSNENNYTNLTYKSAIGEKWVLSFGGAYTLDGDRVELNDAHYSENLEGAHVKASAIRQMGERVKLRMGTEWYRKNYGQAFSNEQIDAKNDFQEQREAAWLESDIHVTNKIVARVGVRGERSELLNSFNVAPRVSTAYKVNEYAQVSAAYGWFYQNPLDEYLIYEDNLQFERADHYILSAQYNKNDRMFRLETYYKDYSNLVKFAPDVPAYANSYNNSGTGFAYGVDVFWRDKKTIKYGDYWVSYSFIDTERDYRDYPGEAVPTFVSKHNVSVVYKHWFNRLRSQLGVTYMYGSPRRYNDLNQPGFNEGRTKSYNSLNMNWSFLYRQNVIFFASVSNVLGFKNVFGYTFSSTPGTDGVYDQKAIVPMADRFFFIGCFITLSRNKEINQLDKIND
ncbi:MAG: TonB-dependent receptor [Flavobacteriales bacterium]|nr:TonB-dependent receptor [Flavobacteriales bacterium]